MIFPIGYNLNRDIEYQKAKFSSDEWLIIASNNYNALIASKALFNKWLDNALLESYMYEASKKLAEIFEKAIKNSPSIVIIDEMEAFLTNRDISKSNHSIEEMAEFLQQIPEAIQNGVLLIAMTNKIDMIDPAILRRGRFDHKIYVGYAKASEIELMLKSKLYQIATKDDIDITKFVQELCEKPMSDINFFIKEAARLVAKNGKNSLDNESLEQALMIIKQENLNTKGY